MVLLNHNVCDRFPLFLGGIDARRIVRAAMQKQNDATPVSLQDFQKRVKQGYQAFELLRTVAEGS